MFKIGNPSGDHLTTGFVLNSRYKIICPLSIHERTRVYLANDMYFRDNRLVAIREILYASTNAHTRLMMFKNLQDAVTLLKGLQHPAIAQIYECFDVKNAAYVVIQYFNGKDLDAIVGSMSTFLPLPLVIIWAFELSAVLHFLHSQQPKPIIFRNLRPSHIMIDQMGKCRLIDFGFAGALWGFDTWLMTDTGAYSPPEAANDPPSPMSDIYSLGATLHFVLTRQDPANEAPFSFTKRSILEAHPDISPEFEALVMRTLAYDPKERYPDVLALKKDLESLPDFQPRK